MQGVLGRVLHEDGDKEGWACPSANIRTSRVLGRTERGSVLTYTLKGTKLFIRQKHMSQLWSHVVCSVCKGLGLSLVCLGRLLSGRVKGAKAQIFCTKKRRCVCTRQTLAHKAPSIRSISVHGGTLVVCGEAANAQLIEALRSI